MDAQPFKFESHNRRVVADASRPATVYYATGALFVASMLFYQRRVFRIDQNLLNFGLFSAGSLFASYQYAATFLSPATTEAAIINNSKEMH